MQLTDYNLLNASGPVHRRGPDMRCHLGLLGLGGSGGLQVSSSAKSGVTNGPVTLGNLTFNDNSSGQTAVVGAAPSSGSTAIHATWVKWAIIAAVVLTVGLAAFYFWRHKK
jgi:hypothetical protein